MEQSYSYSMNVEAEEQVLGALLMEPELVKEINVPDEVFTNGNRQRLYKTLKDMDARGMEIDLPHILDRLGEHNMDKIGGITYLAELQAGIIHTRNFQKHIDLIMDDYKDRQAQIIGHKLAGGADLQKTLEELTNLQTLGTAEKGGDIRDTLVAVYDDIENATGEITGIRSGFHDIDRMTGGFQPEDGQLVIVGARPAMGKTAFALNLAKNAARNPNNQQGDIAAVFSYEMGKKSLLKRVISAEGSIDAQKMKFAKKAFDESDWKKLTMAMAHITSTDLYIYDDAGMDVNYIWAAVRKLQRENPDRRILVVIDYLQLIPPAGKPKNNRQEEVAEISRQLKAMSRELKVVTVALSQLSRGVEQRQDKRPMLSDLRESGQLEQDADIIMFLYRDEYYDAETEEKNVLEVIMAKQREGPTGSVKLAYIKEYNKVLNIDWGRE